MAKCVIDANNKYKTFVEVNVDGTPKYYTMQEGETMIDAKPPVMRVNASADGFVNPTWNGTEWMETATEEEISAWEEEHPAPSISDSEPTQLDRVEAQATYTAMMTDTLLESEA